MSQTSIKSPLSTAEILSRAKGTREAVLRNGAAIMKSYEDGIPNSAPAAAAEKEVETLRRQLLKEKQLGIKF